jgi:photosystem II stability/assembly factor-like uncharacterized protein
VAAGGHDGVYLTRDAGQTWKRISPAANRELQPIMSLAFDPANSEILYAGTPHLPWRTMNGGRAWQSVHRGLIDDSDVFSLEVDTTNPRRVYASACSGIYLSQDRSDNWVKLAGVPRDSRRTYTIRQDPGNPSVVYAGTSRGLWKSLDSGGKWTQISPLVVKSIAFDPRDSRRFVMATDNTGLLETSDGGATTRAVNAGFGDRKLRAIQAAPGGLLTSVLYEGGESGLYRYSREQNRWSAVAADPGARLNFLSLTTIDRNGLLATTHQGAMISTDGGRNWNAMEGPWRSSRLQSFSVLPGSPAVIFAATEAGVYRS